MNERFRFLMIGAMYENGGNTTHRFLDGHPQLYTYPFESQLGTRLVNDHLSSLFPVKYRWPTFALHATPAEDYGAIIDEECKVRARTPDVSKFRHVAFDLSDDERRSLYQGMIATQGRSRGTNVEAFFRATFDAWKDYRRSGAERMYVGYSPIVTVDADKILNDLPEAHVLHIVRNPWSAFADTKKRPVPLSLAHYMTAWALVQHQAEVFRQRFPRRLHILRIEDIINDPLATLGGLCRDLGLEVGASLTTPSWNGVALKEVYPWGTIRRPTAQQNRATAEELSTEEREAIRAYAGPYLERFDYERFIGNAA